MDDLKNNWQVANISLFCSSFRDAFGLPEFFVEELEEAFIGAGTEEGSPLLNQIIIQLLQGCYCRADINLLNYEHFLCDIVKYRWCSTDEKTDPFAEGNFQSFSADLKVTIVHELCQYRLDTEDVLETIKNVEAWDMRLEPVGSDKDGSQYYIFENTRLYKEEVIIAKEEEPEKKLKKKKVKEKIKKKKRGRPSRKSRKKEESEEEEEDSDQEDEGPELKVPVETRTWTLLCSTLEEWQEYLGELEAEDGRSEKRLYRLLHNEHLPGLPAYFEEKEDEKRKRLLEMAPTRASQRLELKRLQREAQEKEEAKVQAEVKRREEDERRKQEKINYEREQKRLQEEKERAREERARRVKLREERQAYISQGLELPPELRNDRNEDEPEKIEMDEDVVAAFFKVLDRIKTNDDAWPFIQPVQKDDAPDYYDVVEEPMDLSAMEDKLARRLYLTKQEFYNDFNLIVENCQLYNGPLSHYTKLARNLQKSFNRAVHRFVPKDYKDDDEDFLVSAETPGGKNRKNKQPEPPQLLVKRPFGDHLDDDDYEPSDGSEVSIDGPAGIPTVVFSKSIPEATPQPSVDHDYMQPGSTKTSTASPQITNRLLKISKANGTSQVFVVGKNLIADEKMRENCRTPPNQIVPVTRSYRIVMPKTTASVAGQTATATATVNSSSGISALQTALKLASQAGSSNIAPRPNPSTQIIRQTLAAAQPSTSTAGTSTQVIRIPGNATTTFKYIGSPQASTSQITSSPSVVISSPANPAASVIQSAAAADVSTVLSQAGAQAKYVRLGNKLIRIVQLPVGDAQQPAKPQQAQVVITNSQTGLQVQQQPTTLKQAPVVIAKSQTGLQVQPQSATPKQAPLVIAKSQSGLQVQQPPRTPLQAPVVISNSQTGLHVQQQLASPKQAPVVITNSQTGVQVHQQPRTPQQAPVVISNSQTSLQVQQQPTTPQQAPVVIAKSQTGLQVQQQSGTLQQAQVVITSSQAGSQVLMNQPVIQSAIAQQTQPVQQIQVQQSAAAQMTSQQMLQLLANQQALRQSGAQQQQIQQLTVPTCSQQNVSVPQAIQQKTVLQTHAKPSTIQQVSQGLVSQLTQQTANQQQQNQALANQQVSASQVVHQSANQPAAEQKSTNQMLASAVNPQIGPKQNIVLQSGKQVQIVKGPHTPGQVPQKIINTGKLIRLPDGKLATLQLHAMTDGQFKIVPVPVKVSAASTVEQTQVPKEPEMESTNLLSTGVNKVTTVPMPSFNTAQSQPASLSHNVSAVATENLQVPTQEPHLNALTDPGGYSEEVAALTGRGQTANTNAKTATSSLVQNNPQLQSVQLQTRTPEGTTGSVGSGDNVNGLKYGLLTQMAGTSSVVSSGVTAQQVLHTTADSLVSGINSKTNSQLGDLSCSNQSASAEISSSSYIMDTGDRTPNKRKLSVSDTDSEVEKAMRLDGESSLNTVESCPETDSSLIPLVVMEHTTNGSLDS